MFKRIVWTLTIVFVLMNIVAGFHAYKFTHFADSSQIKTKSPNKLSSLDKFKTVLFGLNNPRSENKERPLDYYETIVLKSNKN
ncbi:hypothetical protein [Flavobacterium sp.]|uniref:hypothetical protein n=1 Tax=Flavobacterium sp. TaxID=239 RepID=UPI0032660364